MTLLKNDVEIYQLYIWLKHISPAVWRRLHVRSDTTITDLHYYIQIIMGWEYFYLNQFIIRQRYYGVYCIGGVNFADDPSKVYLRDFNFRINEKFIYEYNFHVPWEHDVRVEKKLPLNLKQKYPVCISGSNAGPSEECRSIDEFIELRELSDPVVVILRWHDALEEYEAGEIDREELLEIVDNLKDLHDKFTFNRKAINYKLQDYANNGDEWCWV